MLAGRGDDALGPVQLVGMVSFAYTNGLQTECGKLPDITYYTHVHYFLGWLDSIMTQHWND